MRVQVVQVFPEVRCGYGSGGLQERVQGQPPGPDDDNGPTLLITAVIEECLARPGLLLYVLPCDLVRLVFVPPAARSPDNIIHYLSLGLVAEKVYLLLGQSSLWRLTAQLPCCMQWNTGKYDQCSAASLAHHSREFFSIFVAAETSHLRARRYRASVLSEHQGTRSGLLCICSHKGFSNKLLTHIEELAAHTLSLLPHTRNRWEPAGHHPMSLVAKITQAASAIAC